ncbi:MAG: hypothetical protein A3H98_09735 [Bacteroidetes bacterium RIFCSPLOWO2_02_FULL_36_8]|nr:MAG: hypothetical protein A3H98_09735 [Bacteroidetes bacterium RIFCSPLOWO2_02_FULL_36_8]
MQLNFYKVIPTIPRPLLHLLPLALLMLILFSLPAYPFQNKLLLTSDTIYPAPCYLTFFKEEKEILTIAEVMKIPTENFKPIPDCSPNFGIDEKGYWFRLEIRNENPEIKEWWAEIDLNTLDKINFFLVDSSGHSIEKFAGNLFPVTMKDTRHRNPLFRMKLEHGKEYTLFIRAASTTFVGFPLMILPLSRLHEKDLTYQMFFGIFYGIIFIMIIYNLILYFYIKDRSFIYYVLYMVGMTVNFLCINGYFTLLPIPFSEYFNYHVFNLDVCFITFSACLFTKAFLNTRLNSPIAHKILNVLQFLCLFLMVCEFIFPKQYLVPITNLVTLLTIFIATGISIHIWKKGYTPAGYYLLAFSTLFIAVIAIILTNFGLMPLNWLTLNGMQIASALESVLLSFALGYRINVLKKSKEDFQEKLITQLQVNEKIKDEVNRNLENMVQQRTSALEATNKILSDQKRIIQQKNTDITDSINYAHHIQKAILPETDVLEKYFAESFIYYQPKAIVSGDFYWFSQLNVNGQNRFIISVGDCTGHGVPGALMSMIGNTLLNEIIVTNKVVNPSQILMELNNSIKKILKQEITFTSAKDGMDISVCSFSMDRASLKTTFMSLSGEGRERNKNWILTRVTLFIFFQTDTVINLDLIKIILQKNQKNSPKKDSGIC